MSAPSSTQTAFATATESLNWPDLLRIAEAQASSDPAKKLLRELIGPEGWAKNLEQAQFQQAQLREVQCLLARESLWSPLQELPDPEEWLIALRKNSVLELSALAATRGWLRANQTWKELEVENQGEVPILWAAVQTLPDLSVPLNELEKVLTPDGELSERASPRLGQLYSEIRHLKREISIRLDQVMKDFSQKGFLQDSYSDVRDGRYVLPVKISHQSEVEGNLYEASVSRQTVFIEPKEIAALNNKLRQRQNDLLTEIYLILQDTSRKLSPFADRMDGAFSILAHWDSVAARARLGERYSGKPILVSAERRFRLEHTAHPFLWWSMQEDLIIRNNLTFEDPVRSLLITGPNTGGKTVLLKTLGIAAIFARTGFPFPAYGEPVVPFFDQVFTDLGDPQSIEQHLSSFSGHISRFRQILEGLSDQSLVLLDELNTATDPEEGAALGRAFLETVMSNGAMVVSTTHDPRLKALALNDERILSASMAFDENARTPTYKMLIGVPGRSRALATAERLGIPRAVIELARSYLTEEHQRFENHLGRLENDMAQARRERDEAISLRVEAESLRNEWLSKTRQTTDLLLSNTKVKLRRLVEQASEQVRQAIVKLEENRTRAGAQKIREEIQQSLRETEAQIDATLNEEAPEISAILLEQKRDATQQNTGSIPPLQEGMTVRIPKWKNTGKVLAILKDGKIKVAMGNIQMTLSPGEFERTSTSLSSAPSYHSKPKFQVQESFEAPSDRIDLRGERFETAISRLERYLDQAYRSGALREVTVVHGLGTGAIREGARSLISKLPYIKEFYDGGNGRGGAGATIVVFDL